MNVNISIAYIEARERSNIARILCMFELFHILLVFWRLKWLISFKGAVQYVLSLSTFDMCIIL